jgi:hypothetical protein
MKLSIERDHDKQFQVEIKDAKLQPQKENHLRPTIGS